MAPRNPENIRQRVIVGSLINQRVRLTWYRRIVCPQFILSTTDVVEGVIRANPVTHLFSVLTDDNRSVGFFRRDADLIRKEGMSDEYAHFHNYDGVGNFDYSIEPLGGSAIEQAVPGVAAFDGRPIYYSSRYCFGSRGIAGEFSHEEEYRAWQVSQNSWIEVTDHLMRELNCDSNKLIWLPGGRPGTFHHLFDAWQRANAILNTGKLTVLCSI